LSDSARMDLPALDAGTDLVRTCRRAGGVPPPKQPRFPNAHDAHSAHGAIPQTPRSTGRGRRRREEMARPHLYGPSRGPALDFIGAMHRLCSGPVARAGPHSSCRTRALCAYSAASRPTCGDRCGRTNFRRASLPARPSRDEVRRRAPWLRRLRPRGNPRPALYQTPYRYTHQRLRHCRSGKELEGVFNFCGGDRPRCDQLPTRGRSPARAHLHTSSFSWR